MDELRVHFLNIEDANKGTDIPVPDTAAMWPSHRWNGPFLLNLNYQRRPLLQRMMTPVSAWAFRFFHPRTGGLYSDIV